MSGRERALTSPETAGSSEALARRVADIALDRKAHDLVVLDMRGAVSYTDFLVICTGNTDRQTRAVADAVRRGLKERSAAGATLPERIEGEAEGRWILMDYLDCVVHIFTPDARAYYRLETLWGEVPKVAVE